MLSHEHHDYQPAPELDFGHEHNAVLAFQRSSQLFTDYVLGNSGSITPPAAWTTGLATTNVGSGGGTDYARNSVWSASVATTNINEIGSNTANGYARQTIAKSINTGSIDWGTSSFDNTFATGGQTTAADQVTFGAFSGAPDPNGANSWVLTDGATLNAGQVYFAGDTAATRTFANGDTEKVTISVKAG
jgi:hypothetical protein